MSGYTPLKGISLKINIEHKPVSNVLSQNRFIPKKFFVFSRVLGLPISVKLFPWYSPVFASRALFGGSIIFMSEFCFAKKRPHTIGIGPYEVVSKPIYITYLLSQAKTTFVKYLVTHSLTYLLTSLFPYSRTSVLPYFLISFPL